MTHKFEYSHQEYLSGIDESINIYRCVECGATDNILTPDDE